MEDYFDWDDANTAHIARHGVTPDEAEQAATLAPVDFNLQHVEEEDRLFQVGVTAGGKFLVVVTTCRGDMIRVVTAYDAPAGLKRRYREERSKQDAR